MNRRDALYAVGSVGVGRFLEAPAHANHEKKEQQRTDPLSQMHLYLCAFHIAKKDPKLVFEAHHYCMPVNDEVHQCVIFDSNGENARILGVEYIISDKLYRALPDAEKKYYHAHTYEITSGLLIAPGMAVKDETKLMEGLIKTWGKTWHTWPDPKTALPMGEPLLMWSATKDGHVSKETLAERDKRFGVSTGQIRKRRAHIGPVPQIDFPTSLDDLGRQWTNSGPDVKKGK